MRWSYPLFKVKGISIELHLTFIVWFAFILFAAGLNAFLFFTVLFTIVLAHELIHSFTALLHGIHVPKITLLPIGGLASIDLPDDPLLELKVSISGPLFNFALAGVAAALLFLSGSHFIGYDEIISSVTEGRFAMNSVSGALSVVISLNFILGAFNMLPAFPMDGGRVFRDVLALWMDYMKATRIATLTGQSIFLFLAFLGFVTFNIWWIIIGVFLSYAGGSEMKYVGLRRSLRGLKLGDLAVPGPPYANKDLSWEDFMSVVYRRGQSLYAVTDSEGTLEGILDMGQLRSVDRSQPVGNAATTDYSVIGSDVKVEDVVKKLLSEKLILVTKDSRLLGYVTSESISSAALVKELAEDTI